jgi:predicted alpha-1,2-mannosidase
MRWLFVAALVGCSREPSLDPMEPYDAVSFIDPRIGTGGRGGEVVGLNPGAVVPYGFVQIGPDTRHSQFGQPGFYHFGGYHADDDLVDGFGHTHSNGMGVNDLGGLVVFPRANWDPAFVSGVARAAPFTHDREEASAGYYRVDLQDDDTRVELTATTRGAIHRYTFAADATPVVILDLGYTLGEVEIRDANVTVTGNRMVVFQDLHGAYSRRAGGIPHHAILEVEPTPSGSLVWDGTGEPAPGTSARGPLAGAAWTFPPGTREITMRVGLSTTGPTGAQNNFAAEVEGRTFDQVHQAARQAWSDLLAGWKVRGGTPEEQVILHTALYHAHIWPHTYQDADGTYVGFDKQLHQADHPYHSAFSLWDTYRTTHPLFTLTDPARHEAMLRSLLLMAEQGGDLPRWPIGSGYTGGMVGSPGAIVLAEAAAKGLDLGDEERAFDIAVAGALGPRPNDNRSGIEDYRTLGWVPHDRNGGAASLTLEYAWADQALARWAARLGRTDLEPTLALQGQSWKNLWDAETRFLIGRNADGSFDREFDPLVWSDAYVEGTAWHYVFGAPWDVDGMIELQAPDRQAWLANQRAYWDLVRAEPDDLLYDSYYWHGNEPDLHYAFLGSLAGDHALSVEASRLIMATRYDTTPAGLDGNDDAGTLSAWYVFASAGIYPIAGTTRYALGAPRFERIEIGDLVIRREGPADGTVRAVQVGGKTLENPWVDHDELMAAGELVFQMDKP